MLSLSAQVPKPHTPSSPQTPQPSLPTQTQPPTLPTLSNASDQDVVRITTNLVQVDVVVTKDGKQVTDLKPEDFEIFEDGRRQSITNFTYVANETRRNYTTSSGSLTTTPTEREGPTPPKPIDPREVGRTVAIVVDDLGMSFESMARVRKALSSFITKKLEPADLVAIIRTGGDVGALQQFTTDRAVLQNAVSNLRWNPCSRVGLVLLQPERQTVVDDGAFCRRSAGVGFTVRALRFILRGMSDLPGRKSMMVVSDSLPIEQQEVSLQNSGLNRDVKAAGLNGNVKGTESNNIYPQTTSYADGLNRLAEIAIRSSVVMYSIASHGLQTVGPHAADEISYPPLGTRRLPDEDVITRMVLNRSRTLRNSLEGAGMLARQTGGFLIHNTNDFAFEKVLEDQGSYYLIGYRPAATTFNRRFHHIKARVKRSGVAVRTRAGFYGVSEADAPPRPSTVPDRIIRALGSPFGASEINVRVMPLLVNDAVRGSLLRLFLSFDAKDLTFTEQSDGSRSASLAFTSILFGDNGAIANKHGHEAKLRLSRPVFERAMREGVIYTFDLPVKETGVFQFRIAVLDTSSSRVGAAGQFLTIPDVGGGDLALSGILLQEDVPATATIAASTGKYDLLSNAVLRRFRQGSFLSFGYTIYNAKVDRARAARLIGQTIVFRDGKRIYTSDRSQINTDRQADLKRIATGARLELGPALPPGEYVLQIVVEDQAAKEIVTQWIDFEVVK